MKAADHLFTLRVPTSDGIVTIHAYDANVCDNGTHSRIDVEVLHKGHKIFKRGDTYCATPRCIDNYEAKELVCSLIAMKPGDTDEDYFAGYSPEQLSWAERFGEEISMYAMDRWQCHECGSVIPDGGLCDYHYGKARAERAKS